MAMAGTGSLDALRRFARLVMGTAIRVGIARLEGSLHLVHPVCTQ
jgi:hypothetical protein